MPRAVKAALSAQSPFLASGLRAFRFSIALSIRLLMVAGLLLLNTLALLGLTAGAARSRPALFRAPFNPASLNLAMVGLSIIGYVASRDLPSAARCLRYPEPSPRA